ncbi:hypothetical protein, partial [Bacillus phage SPG24]
WKNKGQQSSESQCIKRSGMVLGRVYSRGKVV